MVVLVNKTTKTDEAVFGEKELEACERIMAEFHRYSLLFVMIAVIYLLTSMFTYFRFQPSGVDIVNNSKRDILHFAEKGAGGNDVDAGENDTKFAAKTTDLTELRQSLKKRFEQLMSDLRTDGDRIAIEANNSYLQYVESQQNCPRQDNVVFLKTHKTGSSTVTSILNRFAELNDLRMLLPQGKLNRFFWPARFTFKGVELKYLMGKDQKANILANHARFDKRRMGAVINKGVKYITILRHPVPQFESIFNYESFGKQMGFRDDGRRAMDMFLQSPMHYYERQHHKKKGRLEALPLLHNSMLFDLGYNFHVPRINVSEKNFGRVLKRIERDFDLVLITEYFDESLVLMMKEFCWSFDDILYMKHNARVKRDKWISAKSGERIKQWNGADVKLYERFNQTFWKKIEKYGEPFWKDVAEFRRKNTEIKRRCSSKTIRKRGKGVKVHVNHFKVGEDVHPYFKPLCEKLFISEVDYIQRFRRKYSLEYKHNVLRRKTADNLTLNSVRVKRAKLKKLLEEDATESISITTLPPNDKDTTRTEKAKLKQLYEEDISTGNLIKTQPLNKRLTEEELTESDSVSTQPPNEKLTEEELAESDSVSTLPPNEEEELNS